jgi:hypothetical protein
MNNEIQMQSAGTHISLEIEEYKRLTRIEDNVELFTVVLKEGLFHLINESDAEVIKQVISVLEDILK